MAYVQPRQTSVASRLAERRFVAAAARLRRDPRTVPHSFPLRSENARLLYRLYRWTLDEARALYRSEGLPLKVTGSGHGRRYILVVALVDRWLLTPRPATRLRQVG